MHNPYINGYNHGIKGNFSHNYTSTKASSKTSLGKIGWKMTLISISDSISKTFNKKRMEMLREMWTLDHWHMSSWNQRSQK